MSKPDDLLTTDLLLHRLHAGLGIAGGARGSLTKCAASSHSKTDLQLQQIELTKLWLTVQRNAAELKELEQQQAASTTTASAQAQQQKQPSMAELRSELERLRQVQSCLQEYEALAKLTVGRHTVSETKLQSKVQQMEEETQKAVADLQQLRAACRVRQGQFHVLQQCILDLQQSLQEPVVLQENELEQAAAQDDDVEEDVMDVDEGDAKQPPKDMEDDEEGELLYGYL